MFEVLGRKVYIVSPTTEAEELLAVGKGLLGAAEERLAAEAEQQAAVGEATNAAIAQTVDEYEALLAQLQAQHEADIEQLETQAAVAYARRGDLAAKAENVGKAVDLL